MRQRGSIFRISTRVASHRRDAERAEIRRGKIKFSTFSLRSLRLCGFFAFSLVAAYNRDDYLRRKQQVRLNEFVSQTLYSVEKARRFEGTPGSRDMQMNDDHLTKVGWIQKALERYERPLMRYAVRIAGNVEMARDVVQDTFLRLCEADRAEVDERLAAWLYAVCRNRALDVLRKEGRMEPLEEREAESVESSSPEPSTIAAENETHGLLLQAIKTLPDNQREAVRLKFQDDMSYREISQVMGVSLGTVSHLIATALGALREQLRNKIDLAKEVK